MKSIFSYDAKVAFHTFLRHVFSFPLRLTFSNLWFPAARSKYPLSRILNFGNRAAPYVTTFRIRTDEWVRYKYHSKVTDELNIAARQNFHFFEPNSRNRWLSLAKTCPNSSYIIDVGAYTGVYSIEASLVAPKTRVLSIEPNVKNLPHLMTNIAVNGLDERITVISVALGSDSGLGVMRFAKEGSSIGSLSHLRNGISDTNKMVPVLKLDDIVIKLDGPVSLIKIDVEGFEGEVLAGATNTLLVSHPTILVEILEEKELIEINEYLANFGYFEGLRVGDEHGDEKNYIFQYQ